MVQHEAPTIKRALLLAVLAVSGSCTFAEDESDTIFPSPDGRYAFRTTRTDDAHEAELIEKATGKVVQSVATADEGRFTISALWTRDSKRFALLVSTTRLSSSVEVFVRGGAKFREIPLPEVDEPKFPTKYENDKRVWHWAAINYQSPDRWTKDGSLVVKCESTKDGNGSYITAMRTVVFGFDRAGKARILGNGDKVTTHFE